MIIRSLAHLKRALVPGVEFEVVLHNRRECIGQIRRVTEANTVGVYSIIPSEPDSKLNTGNGGRGSFLDWGAAKYWTFDAVGVCAKYSDYKDGRHNEIIIAFKVLEAAQFSPCDFCANTSWETLGNVAACTACANYDSYSARKKEGAP